MAISEAQKRAQRKYNDTHQRQIKFSFSIQNDADVLAQLDAVPTKQGYIKDLIRADIARKGPAQKKQEKPMTIEQIIDKAIKEGIFEYNGYRYVSSDWFYGDEVKHSVKRINLESLNRQYEDELKSADEITGWEEIYDGTAQK